MPVARRGEALRVADRHARREHERSAVGYAPRQRRARCVPRTARPSRRSGRRSRRAPTRRPCASARATRRRSPFRPAPTRARRGAARRRPACGRSPRGADRATRRRDPRAPARSSASSHCIEILLVSGPPTRSTTSGRCAPANAAPRERAGRRWRSFRGRAGSRSDRRAPASRSTSAKRSTVVGLHAGSPARDDEPARACDPIKRDERVEHPAARRTRTRARARSTDGRPSDPARRRAARRSARAAPGTEG